MFHIVSILFIVAFLAGLGGGALLLRARRLAAERLQTAEQRRIQLETQLSAFQGAIEALAQALAKAEEGQARLVERVEAVESAGDGGRPYGDAIRLVRQGAVETRLVDELGLNPVEAQLLVRLHGASAH